MAPLSNPGFHLLRRDGLAVLITDDGAGLAPPRSPVIEAGNPFLGDDVEREAPAVTGLANVQWLKGPATAFAIGLWVQVEVGSHKS